MRNIIILDSFFKFYVLLVFLITDWMGYEKRTTHGYGHGSVG